MFCTQAGLKAMPQSMGVSPKLLSSIGCRVRRMADRFVPAASVGSKTLFFDSAVP
jgi:hypothetical protein